MKLTSKSVATLVLGDKRDVVFFDDDMSGFGFRLRAGGSGKLLRSWIVQYRHQRRSRRVLLGQGAVLNAEQARIKARKILAKVALGENPQADKAAEKIMHALVPAMSLHERVAHKFALFLEQRVTPEAYLYRHYQPNGDLLYVGITLSVLDRTDTHLKKALWQKLICLIVIEPFATREEALEAERIAIRNEYPKHNTVHNGQRHPLQELARLRERAVVAPAGEQQQIKREYKQLNLR